MSRRHTIRLPFPIDLRSTLAGIRRGLDDPTLRFAPDGSVWRATRTPDGPATIHLAGDGDAVAVRAWGDGATWALQQAPALIGCFDDDTSFAELHPVVARLRRKLPGLRIGRTDNVFEALLPAVLEQRHTSFEASRAFRQVIAEYGEAAPGPGGLIVPPDPDRLAGIPYYDLHIRGVEREASDALKRLCARAGSLPLLAELPSAEAQLRLCELPGVGMAAAADVARTAFGDPDAVPLGDEQLPSLVSWALTGDPGADDTRMVELLEPWRGQRARVIALIQAGGLRSPRSGQRPELRELSSN